MEYLIDFVTARYNYWIVIVLMMTGLYTVFARGNLVKKIVGLNLFQTSVFIFYITIGKIFGGTAPIYIGGELDHGGGHGDGHEAAGHDAGHGEPHVGAHDASGHGSDHADPSHSDIHTTVGGDKIDNAALHEGLGDKDFNSLSNALNNTHAGDETSSLHSVEGIALDGLPVGKISNDALASAKSAGEGHGGVAFQHGDGHGDSHAGGHGNEHADGVDSVVHAITDAAHHGEAVIYSNPLPHVLILTAIVVGVATTAVGLALAVRIREAYGTIEEDELEAIDNVAEFGDDAEQATGAA